MSKKSRYLVGTSGWQYDHWKKDFYPEGIAKKDWLNFYAQEFSTVEVNGTFYGPVKRKTFKAWYSSVPCDFKFSLKGSRWITHMKKLKGVKSEVKKFYKLAEPLKHKLGCVLWQLPPMLKKDLQRLGSFCDFLDNRRNNAIEFRHKSWFDDETYDLLRDSGVSLCSISAPGLPDTLERTSDTAYVRFHGKGRMYAGAYTDSDLKRWSEKLKRLRTKRVFCYFNNDLRANAVKDAKKLRGELDA
ncbi:DUF72 domain-containing protein [Candidatus Woesearchaeota archaeon]|nr:DUF72 domain-containing protein [Candidatus Woesearchaeota archaeon]